MVDLFKIFCNDVMEQLKSEGFDAQLFSVAKNNVVKTGLNIRKSFDDFISPNFFLDDFFEDNHSVESTVTHIKFWLANPCVSYTEIETMLDNLSVDNLYVTLHNKSTNEKLLENAVSCDFLDLSVVARVLYGKADDYCMSVVIDKPFDFLNGLSNDEILRLAIANTEKTLGDFVIKPITDILVDMLIARYGMSKEEAEFVIESDCPAKCFMFVASNKQGFKGASILVCGKDKIKALANELGTDLYILPSSVNEVILIPYAEGVNLADLETMVAEVNCTEVPIEEKLSDSVYFYSRETDMISLA